MAPTAVFSRLSRLLHRFYRFSRMFERHLPRGCLMQQPQDADIG